jgi:hypothetical protein
MTNRDELITAIVENGFLVELRHQCRLVYLYTGRQDNASSRSSTLQGALRPEMARALAAALVNHGTHGNATRTRFCCGIALTSAGIHWYYSSSQAPQAIERE